MAGPRRPGASERNGGKATASVEVDVEEVFPICSWEAGLRAERDLERAGGAGTLVDEDVRPERGRANGGSDAAFCQPQLGDEALKYKTRTQV